MGVSSPVWSIRSLQGSEPGRRTADGGEWNLGQHREHGKSSALGIRRTHNDAPVGIPIRLRVPRFRGLRLFAGSGSSPTRRSCPGGRCSIPYDLVCPEKNCREFPDSLELLAESHSDSLYPKMGTDVRVAGAKRREAPGPKPVHRVASGAASHPDPGNSGMVEAGQRPPCGSWGGNAIAKTSMPALLRVQAEKGYPFSGATEPWVAHFDLLIFWNEGTVGCPFLTRQEIEYRVDSCRALSPV